MAEQGDAEHRGREGPADGLGGVGQARGHRGAVEGRRRGGRRRQRRDEGPGADAGDRHVGQRLGETAMERQEQQVAQAHERGGAHERPARGEPAGHHRIQQRAHEQRQHVDADDDGDLPGAQPEAVAVQRGVGPGEGGQRSLRAQDRDAKEPGGQLDRPHGLAPQHPDVHERIGLAQLEPRERNEHQNSGSHQRPRPPRAGSVEAHEGQPRRDEQQSERRAA